MFKVGHFRIAHSAVKLHIGDEVQRYRQFFLRQSVFYCRREDQPKDLFNVGIGHFIEGFAVLNLFNQILSLDFNKLRRMGKGDEVVMELACAVFSEVHTQGQSDGGRNRRSAPIHGTGTVNNTQSVTLGCIILQCIPGYIQRFPFRIASVELKRLFHNIIRIQRTGMKGLFTLGCPV